MRVLEELIRVLSPSRRIFVTTASLNSKMLQLILLIFFRKVILSFVLKRGPGLFHSLIVEGKKEFLKKSSFARSWGIFSEFCAKYLVFGEGTI